MCGVCVFANDLVWLDCWFAVLLFLLDLGLILLVIGVLIVLVCFAIAFVVGLLVILCLV